MTLFIDKIRQLQKKYRENSESEDLLFIIEEIKTNPQCIFDTNVTNANEILMILINSMCQPQSSVNYDIFMAVKSGVLDIFIASVNYPGVAWYIIENMGIISLLFDELQKQNANYVNVKILKCLDFYLAFDRNETNTFGYCEESCCEFGLKKRMEPKEVGAACCSLVKLCLKEVKDGDIDGVDLPLVVLNHLYRQYNVHLSPDTCGNASLYDTFRKFLLSVFESKKYSSLCVINALSCFLHCRDNDSNKCFNDTNGKYTLSVIYDIVVKCDQSEQSSSPSLHAIALLTDMLQQPTLVELVRRVWTIDHFKTICKKFIGEYSLIFYETILTFFLAVKDKITDWNLCLHRFLHSNSKLFTFINKLTLHESDRCATLAWRLLKVYFKSSEITDLFGHEYLSAVTNAVKYNLEKSFISDKYGQVADLLIGRQHLRSVNRGLECSAVFLLLMDCAKLSDKLIGICVDNKLVVFIVNLAADLMDVRHNQFLNLQPYAIESLAPFLCHSNTWFVSGARLIVSLMFINVSMSQTYATLVCTVSFEPILRSASFARLLAICMTQKVDNELIERSIALVTFCSHLPDYNISLLSRLMQVNNKFLAMTHRSLAADSSTIVDRNMSSMMSSCLSLTNDTPHCNKHHESVNKMVNSWLSGDKSDFTSSETVVIFEDYIRSLKEHERFLEQSIEDKDLYIRHCNDSVDQYRIKTRHSDSTLQRLTANICSLNEAVEGKIATINELNDVTTDYGTKLLIAEEELTRKVGEISQMGMRCQDTEERLRKTAKDLEGSEELNNELRALLTRYENESRNKDAEIKRLKEITETIENLFNRR